jgi:5-hydroxyisourate hydrolase
MSAITTHVLDAVLGKPGAGIRVSLDRKMGADWIPVGESMTDPDGRCRDLAANPGQGTYRITFATGDYLARQKRVSLYPEIVVVFNLPIDDAHCHLPLLLSDNGYTTYRGS